MKLVNILRDFFQNQGSEKRYWIAYSGGVDSQVLLHLCYRLRKEIHIKLRAIHIHHGLSQFADTWVLHCQKTCAEYDIDLQIANVKIVKNDESLEQVARQRREEVFTKLLDANGMLLTAHHQDDQAETLLLQLFRGAGLQGLAAMPAMKKLGEGLLVRPLLNITRDEILQYAQTEKLTWVEDDSNFNTQYTRNFLRHDFLPLLKKRWPTITATLARTAQHCAEAQTILDNQLSLENFSGSAVNTLSVKKILQLTDVQQKNLLRLWFKSQNFRVPNSRKLMSILNNVLNSDWDCTPHVKIGKAELLRHRDDLYLQAVNSFANSIETYNWKLSEILQLPNAGSLKVEKQNTLGLATKIKEVQVRFRQGGEKIKIGKRHKTLKNFFQELAIPPWQRERIPLIFLDDKLIAIPNYYLEESVKELGGYQLLWCQLG